MTDFRALCAELVGDIEEWMNGTDHFPPSSVELLDRARAALAQPEPQGPTDKELLKLIADELGYEPRLQVGPQEVFGTTEEMVSLLRTALTRWGRPAIEPVPVVERLPGPEDCAPWPDEPDANPWCWAGKEVDGGWEWAQIGMLGVDAKNLGRVLGGGGWTHWLPHHTLPVPQQEVER